MRAWLQRIQGKITLLVVSLVLVSSVVPLGLVFAELQQQLALRKSQRLEGETRLQAQLFEMRIRELIADVQFAVGSPGLHQILASDAGTEQQRHLAAFFEALLAVRPQDAQMRFIDQHGVEVVRVDRYGPDGTLRRVAAEGLQDKSARDYVQATLALPAGQLHISNINLNREFHGIMEPYEPTVRVSTPLYDDRGQLRGMLVINQQIDQLFDEMIQLADPNYTILVTDQDGHYLKHIRAEKAYAFEFNRDVSAFDDFPGIAGHFAGTATDSYFYFDDYPYVAGGVMALRTVAYNPRNPGQKIGIVAIGSHSDIAAVAGQTRRAATLLVLVAVGLAAVLGMLVARRIARPFQRITGLVERRGEASGDPLQTPPPLPECPSCNHQAVCLRLPVDLPGEAGSLAQALQYYLCEIGEKTTALEREIQLREEAQGALEISNHRLMLSNKELEQFVYISSHDLRAPLRVIDNAAAWLEEDLQGKLAGEQLENLQLLRQRTQRMERLLDDLLEYSRIGRSFGDARYKESLSGTALLEQLQFLVTGDSSAKLTIEGPWEQIEVTRMPLQHVLANLVNNAVKHGGTAVTKIILRVTESDQHFVFEVEDDGPGIEAQYRDRVFALFQTLKPRDEVEGSGMGLAIVKKVLDYYGGSIELRTSPGGGCLFVVSWPKKQKFEPWGEGA